MLDDCGGIKICDLAKAFDCVNHELLLIKLQYYGIQETVAYWLRSCLTENKKLK
jgi:hypothetical protein